MFQQVNSTREINTGDKVFVARGDKKIEATVTHKTPSGRVNVETEDGYSMHFLKRGVQSRPTDPTNPFVLIADVTGEQMQENSVQKEPRKSRKDRVKDEVAASEVPKVGGRGRKLDPITRMERAIDDIKARLNELRAQTSH